MWSTLFPTKIVKRSQSKPIKKQFFSAPHLRFFHPTALPNMRPVRNTQRCTKPSTGQQQWKKATAGALIVFLCGSLGQTANATDSTRYQFNIPPLKVEQALGQLAKQTGHQLLFSYDLVDTHQSTAVQGEHSINSALQQLLQSTPLTGDLTERGVIIITDPRAQNHSHKGRGNMNTNTNKRKSLLATMVGLMAAGGMTTASAQETESARAQGVLDEIIITATKRETNLNETAVSITALDSEDISRRGLEGMDDYLRFMPGVNILTTQAGVNPIIVRGIASNPDPQFESETSGPSTAVYFGEIPVSGLGLFGGTTDLKLVDMQQVEVLRGPQGTLYGAGSLSGTVRNIPNSPNVGSLESSVKIGFSNTEDSGGDNYTFQGMLNVPLIDNVLAMRIVGYRDVDSGYYRNIARSDSVFLANAIAFSAGDHAQDQDDIGQATVTGGRVNLTWKPTDELDVSLQYVTQEVEQKGLPGILAGTDGYTQTRLGFPEEIPGAGSAEGSNDEIDITNLVVEYDFGWAKLLSSSSWLEQEYHSDVDQTVLVANFPSMQVFDSSREIFVEELRLASELDGPLQFLVGLYYEDLEGVRPQPYFAIGDPALSIFGAPYGDTNPLLADLSGTGDRKQEAFFGEMSYEISDEFSVTVGGRWFDYEKLEATRFLGVFGDVDSTRKLEESGSNYKANLSYQPDDETLIYAQWSEGYRLGSTIIPPPASLCDLDSDGILDGTTLPISDSFDSDFLESYELGSKLKLLDSRLQVNLAVFHMNWDGIPIGVQSPTCLFVQTANAGKAISQGFEGEISYLLSESLHLNMSGSYTNAELSEDAPTLSALDGDRLPGSPRYNISFGIEYDFDVSGHSSFIRTDYTYVGGFYNNLQETGIEAGDYGQLNLNGGVALNENTELELFVRNATNEDSLTWLNAVAGWRLAPRTIGLNISFNY